MERKNISSGSSFEAEIGYSRAVVTGSWILVSGTTGYDYTTGVLPPTIIEQTEQTLKNISSALAEAGASLKDVVRVTYILPDKKEFPLIWPVLRRAFGDVRPAATMMQAELMRDEMRIEIEVTARKEGSEGEGSI
ncbi:endoribonuclease L-PSP [Leptodontidium sp. MPI-SDFR-AT-0119]|nr:endoribonuclease L-PSP [Leptodontidium sp. MPI-SDFR-AT-0119]